MEVLGRQEIAEPCCFLGIAGEDEGAVLFETGAGEIAAIESGQLIFKGTLNLYIAYTYPTDTWVTFKLFGGMGLMVLFIVAQAVWLSKYLPDDADKPDEPPKRKALP